MNVLEEIALIVSSIRYIEENIDALISEMAEEAEANDEAMDWEHVDCMYPPENMLYDIKDFYECIEMTKLNILIDINAKYTSTLINQEDKL